MKAKETMNVIIVETFSNIKLPQDTYLGCTVEEILRGQNLFFRSFTKRNHKCHHCGKSFHESSGLKNHIKTVHEGHRDLKCNYCEKSFSVSVVLKRHIKAGLL